jgi:hypothetical protein
MSRKNIIEFIYNFVKLYIHIKTIKNFLKLKSLKKNETTQN